MQIWKFHIFLQTEIILFPREHWIHNFKELNMDVEIFNLFNSQNSITNIWVRDATSKQQYAIPNFMTSRIFNLKIGMQF